MDAREALSRMIVPSMKRPTWLNGIIQIHVGRACDRSCLHCSQGSDLAGKVGFMTPDEFEQAVRSLGFGGPPKDQYFGVCGTFGGNPALSPHFGAYCEILRGLVPLRQRGLWCNHPRGKGQQMRATYWPAHSNLNTHMDREAYEEFARDWPESIPYLKGMDRDSIHSSPWVAMQDVEPDEGKRWEYISKCDVNQFWSSLIGVVPGRGLRAYLCEIAFAQAATHAVADDAEDWPDLGIVPFPGWWKKPIGEFEAQVRLHCMACGIPLRRPGKEALGCGPVEFSRTHAAIARPKVKSRPVEFVESIGMVGAATRPDRPATEYLPGTTPRPTAR